MPFKLINNGSGAAVKAPSEETLLGSGVRNLTRLGARTIESVAGLPGSIESGIRGLTNLASNAATGSPLVSQRTILPTPQDIRSIGSQNPESQYLEPRGSNEETADKVISTLAGDIAPFLVSGGTAGIPRALKIIGAGNTAKWLTQKVGGSEQVGDIVKTGTMLATSLLGAPKIEELASEAYKAAEGLLPEKAAVTADKITPTLDHLTKKLKLGLIEAPNKQQVASIVSQLKGKITKNKIPVEDLLQTKQDLNKIIPSLAGRGGKLQGIGGLLPKLSDGVRETISEYGKANPEFFKTFSKADELWRASHAATPVTQFLRDNINDKTIGYGFTSWLLGLKPLGSILKGIATGVSALNVGNFLERFMRSPLARQHYYAALRSAAQENSVSLAKNVAKLDTTIGKLMADEGLVPEQSGRYKLLKNS